MRLLKILPLSILLFLLAGFMVKTDKPVRSAAPEVARLATKIAGNLPAGEFFLTRKERRIRNEKIGNELAGLFVFLFESDESMYVVVGLFVLLAIGLIIVARRRDKRLATSTASERPRSKLKS